jgi:hypothetical protein
MARPHVATITCSQCNGWYGSERELWEHMQTAHRRYFSGQSTFKQGDSQPDISKDVPSTSKEEWAELSLQLRDRIQVRFNPEELDIIDRFILLASQGSVFDQVCRSPRLLKFVDRTTS